MLTQVESRTIIESLRAELRGLHADYETLIAAREALARAEEREACAALAEEHTGYGGMTAYAALTIAAAIRARDVDRAAGAEGE